MFPSVRANRLLYSFFFFNDTATTEIYTLSLHDALPISLVKGTLSELVDTLGFRSNGRDVARPACTPQDRKSTRLNSSHSQISYAVFCLKKKRRVKGRRRSTIALMARQLRSWAATTTSQW